MDEHEAENSGHPAPDPHAGGSGSPAEGATLTEIKRILETQTREITGLREAFDNHVHEAVTVAHEETPAAAPASPAPAGEPPAPAAPASEPAPATPVAPAPPAIEKRVGPFRHARGGR